MIGISRQADYAIRIVVHLASLPEGDQEAVRRIAEERLLPLSFVRRIVARLAAAGILRTSRGMGGGIQLARPAADISLLDVVRVIEGPIGLNQCVTAQHTCPFATRCPVQAAWSKVTRDLEKSMEEISFDVLAHGSEDHVLAHRTAAARASSSATKGPPRARAGARRAAGR
jgi:Rrf2 family protein